MADFVGTDVRTITNWTSGKTMPSQADRAALRRMLGEYDAGGDQVERALLECSLTEDRQYAVLAFYKRQLREQGDELAREA